MAEKIIDLELCKTCPQGYPWACKACQRHDMGCERPKKEPKEIKNGP